ncbi:hypothetical protein LJR289_003184 [Pseudoduganella sp. LjRoot289]|uniref:hypothetical protein n=1 Tax=Pseudoduganella sp. LjRoot289 TaxID=3342314 RepID=UPI003ED140A7
MTTLKRLLYAVLLFCSFSAHAGTAGDQVSLRYYYPDLATPTASFAAQLVDSDGALFSNVAGVFDLTVTDTQIIINHFNTSAYWLPGSYNGFVVSNLDHAFHPLAALGRQTNMAGFSLANVAISGNAAYVNWQGLSFDESTQLVLYISAIPEPASYAMLLAGACILLANLLANLLAAARREGRVF